MCGIFGVVDWADDLPPLPRLLACTNLLRHRGPDGGGYWTEPHVFLGHRRLSIIDLAGGVQPMASADGRYVLTFNGEIYNYPELRDELRPLGRHWHTSSDTEVVLAAFEAWGTDAFARLEGMFALGLYDRRDGSLLLARDRFGEKPLLVAHAGGRVAFASEMAPLSALLGPGVFDDEALGGYLALNYVPGCRTLRRDIARVAPGEWRRYRRDAVEARRYWSVQESIETGGYGNRDAALNELQRRVDHSVRLSLRSDVPVGLFLSGGTDSAIVAESAARQGRVEAAFCVDVGEKGFSEWAGASHVARQLGIELVRVPFQADVLDGFLDVAAHLDDPLADSSAMAVWTVARGAARRVKVVLSGDGGDEAFGGYLTYPASAWHRRLSRVLPHAARAGLASLARWVPTDDAVKVGAGYKARRFLRALPLPTSEAHFSWNGTWLPSEGETLVRTPALRAAVAGALTALAASHGLPARPTLTALQVADATDYLPNDILVKVDRSTMAHGLESRAPLLHPLVACYGLGLPDRWRVGTLTGTKRLLRALTARHFGARHAYAPKQGFSIPVHQWLRGPGRPLLTRLLDPGRVAALGVLDPAAVTAAVTAHLEQRRSLGWELWGLMTLVAWSEGRLMSSPSLTEPSGVAGALTCLVIEAQ